MVLVSRRGLVRAVADMTALRDAARDYAAYGLPVFPLAAGAKVPMKGSHGFEDASSHREHVWHWWQRDPWANIGIPTGRASGWLVIDIDGPEGRAGWEQLTARHGQVSTLVQLTGGLGLHLVFQYPAGLELGNSRGRLPRRIDVRGQGGYIVAPPSRHPSGRRYEWLWPDGYPDACHPWNIPQKPATCPQWLLELLLPPKPKPTASRAAEPVDGGGAELVAWLAKQGQGNRNAGLYWAACKALERGYSDDVLKALIDASVDTSGGTPHTRLEAEATVASARRYKGYLGG